MEFRRISQTAPQNFTKSAAEKRGRDHYHHQRHHKLQCAIYSKITIQLKLCAQCQTLYGSSHWACGQLSTDTAQMQPSTNI